MSRTSIAATLLTAFAACGRDPAPAPAPLVDRHLGVFVLETEGRKETFALEAGGRATWRLVMGSDDTGLVHQEGTIRFPEVVNRILMDAAESAGPHPTQHEAVFFLVGDVLNQIHWSRAAEFRARRDKVAVHRFYTVARYERVPPPK